MGGIARWLLIGNSRWHWAEPTRSGLRCWHTAGVPDSLPPLLGWAASGPIPVEAGLPCDRRLTLSAIPLAAAPPWLGVDRALGGWQAWRTAGGPVLVMDAGTVLSLTRVDRDGRFRGGRLMAGVALQLRAMAAGTAHLPLLSAAGPQVGSLAEADSMAADCLVSSPSATPWPTDTSEAMVVGVQSALAAAILTAVREVGAEDCPPALWFTGGDGELLLRWLEPQLAGLGVSWVHRPHLCLEAIAALSPVAAG